MDIERYTVQQFITALAVDTNTARAWFNRISTSSQHAMGTMVVASGYPQQMHTVWQKRTVASGGSSNDTLPLIHIFYRHSSERREGDIRVDYTAIWPDMWE
jgi:cell division FtsZ-interacting protein ZapD